MPAGFWAAYVAKLAVVGLLLTIAYAVARRLKTVRPFGAGRCLKLLETTALSTQAAIHLVRVGTRYFLIGSAAEVRVLAELQPSDAGAERPTR